MFSPLLKLVISGAWRQIYFPRCNWPPRNLTSSLVVVSCSNSCDCESIDIANLTMTTFQNITKLKTSNSKLNSIATICEHLREYRVWNGYVLIYCDCCNDLNRYIYVKQHSKRAMFLYNLFLNPPVFFKKPDYLK